MLQAKAAKSKKEDANGDAGGMAVGIAEILDPTHPCMREHAAAHRGGGEKADPVYLVYAQRDLKEGTVRATLTTQTVGA